MQQIKNSESTAARRRIPFNVVDSTDYVTPKTGLTFTSTDLMIGKNGAAEAAFGGTVTEIAAGLYSYEATQAETNTFGYLTLRINKTACYASKYAVQIVNHDPYGSVTADTVSLGQSTAALQAMKRAYLVVVATGTVTTSPNAATNSGVCTFQATGITEQTADHYNGRLCIFDSGVMDDSAGRILDYSWDAVNSQGVFTLTLMQEVPVNGTTFIIV